MTKLKEENYNKGMLDALKEVYHFMYKKMKANDLLINIAIDTQYFVENKIKELEGEKK
jgi:hypothetical protein